MDPRLLPFRARWRRLAALASIAVAAGAAACGTYGECETDADCGRPQSCMAWPRSAWVPRPWHAEFKTYQTCEILCETNRACPAGYFCREPAHGEPLMRIQR